MRSEADITYSCARLQGKYIRTLGEHLAQQCFHRFVDLQDLRQGSSDLSKCLPSREAQTLEYLQKKVIHKLILNISAELTCVRSGLIYFSFRTLD